jgi:hypothetical protein
MNSAAPTKIFGIRLGIDPKVIVAVLIGVAALLFWYNSRGDEEAGVPATAARPASASPPATLGRAPVTGAAASRRSTNTGDHGTLRLRAVDATRGDIDPTLRLDLLARLQSVTPGADARNLFQMGAAPLTDAAGRPIQHPIIPVKPVVAPPPPAPAAPVLNIPLKYYGFAKPVDAGENKRGFFLDGDNIVIAAEGEVVKQRYMIVELTATSARVEDTQLKQGKALPLEPEAKDTSLPSTPAAAGFGVEQ